MRIIGNLLWWFFGGLEAAIGYFTGSLALACTIIGIPWGKQHFKMAGISRWLGFRSHHSARMWSWDFKTIRRCTRNSNTAFLPF